MKNWLIVSAGTLLLSAGLVGVVSANERPVARVVSLTGTAQLDDSAAATRGTALHEGSIVETGADSRLRMRFNGGSLLTLGENTRFEISRYEPATDTTEQTAYFRVLSGVILAIADGVTPGTDAYVIETPAASIGIRGTIVWGGYFIPGQADYILLEGGPVTITNTSGEVLLTEIGQGTTVLVDDDGRDQTAPYEPEFWDGAKLFEAVTTIAFP
ncbi:FecR family protein [Salinispirillum sp. LH 10-3-1]|uniref:FecR family protein n=1 Tax=Salinispirillum sp. LH 10-3-1 TaxID=2952525 RepID=A0AB38YFN9_9GAMM